MTSLFAIFLGGGIGSVLRWCICTIIHSQFGTFTVNILGAFLIGIAYQYISQKTNFNADIKLFIMTGLLGGFTTFSTYLLDFVSLVNKASIAEAFLYLVMSVVVGCLLLYAGMKLVSFFN